MNTPVTTLSEKHLRWKSRRGLLELDLLLNNFWQKYGGGLTEEELFSIDQYLQLDDYELWNILRISPTCLKEALKKQ